MSNIIKSTDEWLEYTVSAWWLHILPSFKGEIFILGDFHPGMIHYLKTYCNTVYYFPGNKEQIISDDKIIIVEGLTDIKFKFNSIIINANNNPELSSTVLLDNLINDNLIDDGQICILEKAVLSLPNNLKAVIKSFVNLFYDSRYNEISKLSLGMKLFKLPTHVYNNKPHDSFFEGHYFTNKNVFLFKEKIKSLLLRTVFSRLVVGHNVWMLSKNSASRFLHEEVKSHVFDAKNEREDDFIISGLFYKRGKIIYIYKSKLKNIPHVIAILCFDEEVIRQRKNEKQTIEYLNKFDNFSLPTEYTESNYQGFVIFSMRMSQGITVDTNSSHLERMTINASEELIKLVKITKKTISHEDMLSKWMHKLVKRSPGFNDELNIINEFLKSRDLNISVCMHGDAKLENFVLNRDYSVNCIIDWEHAVINGLPLIDIYYLIIYNLQTKYSYDFSDAYEALIKGSISKYESNIIKSYCHECGITERESKVMLVIFFIHHYSCRFYVDIKFIKGRDWYKNALTSTINLIKEID